jgi:predicted metal-binding protein
MDRAKIESIMRENGYDDFKWISGKDVVVSQWPRFKCMYGCSSYGKKGSCPPSVPSVASAESFSANMNISLSSTFRKSSISPMIEKSTAGKPIPVY